MKDPVFKQQGIAGYAIMRIAEGRFFVVIFGNMAYYISLLIRLGAGNVFKIGSL
jgi:hypothetical protein